MSEVVNTPAPTPNEAPVQATETPESKPPETMTKAEKKLYNLNLYGKEKQVDETELLKYAQIGGAASEKFESAAKKEKEIQDKISKFSTDPIAAIMELKGCSEDEAFELFEKIYYKKKIEPTELSKEEIRARELEEKLSKYEKAEKEQREKAEAEELDKLTTIERTRLQEGLVKAIDEAKLPKTQFTVSRFAFYMRKAADQGIEVPMEYIAQQVSTEQEQIVSNLVNTEDMDRVESILGEPFIKKLLAHSLQKIRGKRDGMVKPISQSQPSASMSGEKIDETEVQRRMNLMRQGKLSW